MSHRSRAGNGSKEEPRSPKPNQWSMRMWTLVAVAALLVGLAPEIAVSAPRRRTVEKDYLVVGVEVNTRPEAYVYTNPFIKVGSPKLGERSVMVTVEDQVTDPVPATLAQDPDDDGHFEIAYDFCGATPEPVRVIPNAYTEVWLGLASCPGTTDVLGYGEWFKGTIKLEYSTEPAERGL